MRAFWGYCRAIIRHWTAFATSSVAVAVLAVATQGFAISVPGWVYLALFGGGVVWAGFRAWEEKRTEALRHEAAAEDLRCQVAVAPRVRIIFAGDGNMITVNLKEPPVRSPEEKSALLQTQRDKHPLIALSAGPFETAFGRMNLGGLLGAEEVPAADYNAQLKNYYERYAEWLEDVDRHAITMSRSAELQLEVRNDGTAPARKVDVTIAAARACAFVDLEDRKSLRAPRKPKPPKRVMSPPDPYASARNFMPDIIPMSTHFEDPRIGVEPLQVTVWTASLKVGRPIAIPPFLLLWNVEGSRITLDYEITAEELPAPSRGELTIELRPADTR